jgi:uncharacterized protein (TIGR01777 family)
MNYFISGGLGFVGRRLTQFILDQGHNVRVVGLRPKQDITQNNDFKYISADTSKEGDWQDAVAEADVIYNLAGKTISKRWTKSYKEQIYDSRILTTRNIVAALPENKTITFCSTSAVGYYGDRGEETLTENATSGDDFLAKVGIDWETEAFAAENKGIRVITARFGIVLGKNGGALEKMLPAFKSFVGGPLGSGRQWFPWIHMDDMISGLMFVTENENVRGPVNLCSPNPVRNQELAKALGNVLNRPAVMTTPGFMIRLAMGEIAGALLASQRVAPEKLLEYGFQFKFPDLKAALEDILGSRD